MSGTNILKNVELTRIFKELKSKNAGIQIEASRKLYYYLLKHSEDCDDIFEEFNDLLQSTEKENKLGCFIAINKILTVGRETRIVHYVNKIMPMMFKQMKINNPDLVEKAAECLGNLAKAGGSITAETVEKTLDQAINWLQGDKSSKSNDIKKYSAVLVFREFLKKLPIVTFNKLFDGNSFYKFIFIAFRDHRVNVRETSADCINICLHLISEREQQSKQSLLSQVYEELQVAFKENEPNFQHSALTVLAAIIASKGSSSEIIKLQGGKIINNIMKLNSETKNAYVKKKCIELIPILAKHIPDHFSDHHLEFGIKSIFSFINKKENAAQKGVGFLALGKMSLLIQSQKFKFFLPETLSLIEKEIGLSKQSDKSQKQHQMCLEVLSCVKMLLKNYGDWLDSKINMICFINDIFYSGFNKQLIETLNEMSKACGGKYRVATSIKLLNAISTILTQRISLFPLGSDAIKRSNHDTSQNSMISPSKNLDSSPEERKQSVDNSSILNNDNMNNSLIESSYPLLQQQSSVNLSSQNMNESQIIQDNKGAVKIDHDTIKKLLQRHCSEFLLNLIQSNYAQSQSDHYLISNQKTQLLSLALKTLANYDFSEFSHSVTQFIENSVLTYLDDENPRVRKEAVKTCCQLSFSTQYGQGQQRLGAVMVKMVNKLLHKFFETATTDNDYKIRTTMLEYLNKQFDPFISKYENLLMLFNCMQDQNYEIKEKTIRILGRLVPYNSSQILPYLRNLIVSLMNQLEHSKDPKEREEAAKLIKTFVRANRDLSKAYASSLLKVLIQKINGENAISGFISAVLEAIGEISNVECDSVKPYMGELFPLILECIKDQSSAYKREVAVKTLISLVENTGFVVKPFFFYPEIINHIRNLVQNEQQPQIKKLVLTLIGTLGALDPYLLKQITIYYNSPEVMGESQSNIPLLYQIDQQSYNPNFKPKENNIDLITEQSIFKSIFRQRAKSLMDEANSQQFSDSKNQDLVQMNSNTNLFKNQIGNKGIDMNKYLKQYDFQESKEIKYPTKAIEQMIKVLLDTTLRDHHHIVLQGIKYIVHTLGQDSIVFLPLIIPPIMIMIQNNDTILNESLYQCINAIISTVPKSISKFSDIIFDSINEVLYAQSLQVLELIRLLNIHCKDSLITEMYLIIPKVLQLIESKKNEEIEISIKGIQTLKEFHVQVLNDHLYIIIPLLLRICSNGIQPIEIKLNIEVIQIFDNLKECGCFREHIAQIVHQLIQIMETQINQTQFVQEILRLFCSLTQKLTIDFAPYISLISKTLKRNKIQCEQFEFQVEEIVKINPINLFNFNLLTAAREEEEQLVVQQQNNATASSSQGKKTILEVQESRKKHISFEILLKEFDTSKCSIEADWIEWLKKTSNQLLKQSPSPILYACSTLAEVYAPIATELYNIAFVSCWRIMTDMGKEKIMENYKHAINSKNKPTVVLQTILNLAEFMELDETTDIKLFAASTLAKIAEQCNAYAKALYYWEMEFENDPRSTIELLIKTNYGLQQPEAAQGILDYAKKNILMDEKEDWYEKLRKWRDALRIYEQKEMYDPNNFEILKGKMNCFRNLSDWENLSREVEQMWNNQPDDIAHLREIAEHASYSAWNLGKWDNFQKYVKMLDISKHNYEKNFYQAVLDIKSNKFMDAQKHIDKAREILDPKITSLLGESYNRAYLLIQEMQNLRELEEIIDYKATNYDPSKYSTSTNN